MKPACTLTLGDMHPTTPDGPTPRNASWWRCEGKSAARAIAKVSGLDRGKEVVRFKGRLWEVHGLETSPFTFESSWCNICIRYIDEVAL